MAAHLVAGSRHLPGSGLSVREAFSGQRILVTGGGGFIGSHLIEQLLGYGAAVTTVDRRPTEELPNLEAVIGKITAVNLDLVAGDVDNLVGDLNFDLIFHLAASTDFRMSVDRPRRDLEENAIATLNLLEAIRRTSPSSRLIHASSALIYSGGPEPLSEDGLAVPNSPYGISKLAAEQYVRVYAKLHGIPTVVGRLFAVFGPRLRKHVIYEIIHRLIADPTTLRMRGDGTEVRDFTYVGDVVNGLLTLAALAPMNGESYNLASGQPVTIDTLIRLITSAMGTDPEVHYTGPEHSGATSTLQADIRRLSALGYSPQTSLREGLQRTIDWAVSETDPRKAGLG